MSKHAVYTRFTAQPEKGDALVEILRKANHIVSGAEGCRHYIINHDTDNTDEVWVTELWDSPEDHAISLTLDGCKELVVEATPLLAIPPEQIALKAVAGKGVEE
ncbi:MAG: antibiotic biosynthesis monooxygenase [Sediminibacterium sp.]|jgi:quinol monooxygenase YgiN|nr:antibiotic biosynthesis monooxygenase [Sediminibacterium sp.]